MNYVNQPTESPKNMTHKTFYSSILEHEIGYNIYLPTNYLESDESYSVVYHIHGWQGNESSEIGSLEKVCRGRHAITVFMNVISSENTYFPAILQIESILFEELIPHIEGQYRTKGARENRSLSGFSMGGAMAFYYAVKHCELFGSVTTYAGTYHHQYHEEYDGVGKSAEAAIGLYDKMMQEERYLEKNNILTLIRQKANEIRTDLQINIHIGTSDILFCDNEILHMYLNALDIPHEYKKYIGVEHVLEKIV